MENALALPPLPTTYLSAAPGSIPPAGTSGAQSSPIAGSVLPIQRAEELLATLPGVISARIMASPMGAVDSIHLLTTDEVGAKQTVRNVESALIAHLGMRISHKKISVATSSDPSRPAAAASSEGALRLSGSSAAPSAAATPGAAARTSGPAWPQRVLYFEDVEVRRSRSHGVTCRVTLRKGERVFVGEAEGLENERQRIELAARATLSAMADAATDVAPGERAPESQRFALEGCRAVEAFERDFVFVGVTVKAGRDAILLTGSAEIRSNPETSAVLAVLDATNRWLEYDR